MYFINDSLVKLPILNEKKCFLNRPKKNKILLLIDNLSKSYLNKTNIKEIKEKYLNVTRYFEEIGKEVIEIFTKNN